MNELCNPLPSNGLLLCARCTVLIIKCYCSKVLYFKYKLATSDEQASNKNYKPRMEEREREEEREEKRESAREKTTINSEERERKKESAREKDDDNNERRESLLHASHAARF